MATAITSYKERAERLKGQLSRIREKGKQAAKTTNGVLLTVAGGAAAGAMAAKMPKLPGTEIPSPVGVGGLLVVAGVAGLFDEMSDNIAQLGAGMLCATVALETEKALNK